MNGTSVLEIVRPSVRRQGLARYFQGNLKGG